MNNVVLIGNLARNPELKYTDNGKAVTRITVAVNRGWGKEKGADFIDVTVWEKQAEACHQYLTKGSKVGVQGRLQVRSYEKDGERKWITDVVAREVEFLGGSGQAATTTSQPVKTQTANSSGFDDGLDLSDFETMEDDGDLPF